MIVQCLLDQEMTSPFCSLNTKTTRCVQILKGPPLREGPNDESSEVKQHFSNHSHFIHEYWKCAETQETQKPQEPEMFKL